MKLKADRRPAKTVLRVLPGLNKVIQHPGTESLSVLVLPQTEDQLQEEVINFLCNRLQNLRPSTGDFLCDTTAVLLFSVVYTTTKL
jgi:hypothetical protein